MKKKVVFILGPTAVGKSEVALCVAKKFDGEIISADSVQIFRGLDIGSAKISTAEMDGVVHHGIDICDAKENFSAYQFAQFTKKKIDEISSRGKLPVVVGGTGLYIRSLVEGFNFGGADVDEQLRAELDEIHKQGGTDALFEILQKIAPQEAAKIDCQNPRRLVRAIEIAKGHGQKSRSEVEIDPLVLALVLPREQLYEKINLRVDRMLENGLIDEVRNLKAAGLTAEHQSMKAIGYKEVLAYLDGEVTFQRMAELVKQHSRNYAKRQMTFLRGMNCQFVDMQNRTQAVSEIEKQVADFLKK